MPRTLHHSAILTIIPAWFLSVAILMSAAHFNVAQAQNGPKKSRVAVAIACGNELTNQCNGAPVFGNNMLACLQNGHAKLSRICAALASHVVHMCERDAATMCQGVVFGGSNILGCLTTARGSVSSGCNSALDAVFLRR